MRQLQAQQQQKVAGNAGRLVRRCGLMAATLAALTACQSNPPSEPQPLANTEQASATVQQEHTEKAATPAPPTEASPPPAAAPNSAASAPQTSTEVGNPDYTVRWLRPLQDRDPNDGVEVIDHGWLHGVQLIITSSSGTGAVEVQPVRTVWRNPIQVQFQYAPDKSFDKLERLYLQVVDSAPLVGDQAPEPEPANGFVVWQRDGALCVDLPTGWLHVQETLHIAWADRIRSSPLPPSSSQTQH
jgi:hypothetical protein